MTDPSNAARELAGRRIAVTGAAGGNGAATVRRLVAAGARVALIDRDEAALRPIAEELAMPAFVCDVVDPGTVERTAPAVEDALGGIDGLVNGAGVLLLRSVEAMTAEEWLRVTNVNLFGPFLVSKAFAPALCRAGRSTIVNIASIGALRPARSVSAYASAKAGLLMFGKCLAMKLAPEVRVNSVCPGTTDTAMVADLLEGEGARDRLERGPALGRLGQPADIAEAILYLTSERSAYVNGSALVVDGGYSWS